MFAFVKERKAVATLRALAGTAPGNVRSGSPIERCSALILANVLLIRGAQHWGRSVLDAPTRLDRFVAADAVCSMADDHERRLAIASTLDGRSAADPIVSAYRWEIAANETVILTIGCGLDDGVRPAMVECWRSLWSARRSAEEAVHALAHYARAYSLEPTPRIGGKVPSAAFLRRVALVLPPMFRPTAGKPTRK